MQIEKIKEKYNLVVLSRHGSHLYGTDTENSDTDYKGIFLPTLEDVILQRIPKSIHYNTCDDKSKNSGDDIDIELHSLHHFIKLACEGQTIAVDLLFSTKNHIIESSSAWNDIVKNRDKLFSKDQRALLEYCMRQASKYGIKGSRLDAVKNAIEFLDECENNDRLSQVWNQLPRGEHTFKYEATSKNNNQRMYEVCGRKFPESVRVEYAIESLSKVYDKYGERAKAAQNNDNIDWKALSHAVRAAKQLIELYSTGNIIFPLKDKDLLVAIKTGKMDYTTEVAPLIEKAVDEVEKLAEKSGFPAKVNTKYWDEFILGVYGV